MNFMIDFENTRDRGLDGAEYLTKEDSVTIFYSNSCKKIGQGRLQQIIDSKCEFDICCLQNTGKNALDFYIASRIGEIYGSGFSGTTAIVSKDNGFKAVKDYWKSCSCEQRNIILKPDIQESILSANEDSVRRVIIKEKLKDVDISIEFKRYEERIKIRKRLETIFLGSEYEKMIDKIMDIIEGETKPKVVYLNSLKRFGRTRGLKIYHLLKEVI